MNDISLAEIKAHLEAKDQEATALKQELQGIREVLVATQVRLQGAEELLQKYIGTEAAPAEPPPPPQQERPAQTQPLKDYIMRVLENSNEPLTSKEIADLVREAGYKTASRDNFVQIVHLACVKGPEFRRVSKAKQRPVRFALKED